MAPPILDLNDATNWAQMHDATVYAEPLPLIGDRYYPIPYYNVPGIFSNRSLVIGASSTKTKPTWYLAFYIILLAQISGIGLAQVAFRRVPLGLTIIRVPQVASEYKLRIKFPKWHQEMSFTIWQYIGVEYDVLDVLDEIKTVVSQ